jgi:hypothetical protein
MSKRGVGRELRWMLRSSAAWMTLLALSACSTVASGQRPDTPQPMTPPSSVAAAPTAGVPPAAAASPGASTAPPAAAAPDAPVPTGSAAATQTPTAPPSAASGQNSPGASNSDADKMLPPCVPVHRVRPKHHKPKKPPVPQTEEPTGPPPPAPADAVVDAQVGEVGTSLGSILGRDVKSPKGEDLGRVVDVLADAQGHVRVAIIDFGGFLGVGTRRIAVDWPLLRFDLSARDKPLILSVDRQKLQSAPEYNTNKPRVLMPPAAPDVPDAGQATK